MRKRIYTRITAFVITFLMLASSVAMPHTVLADGLDPSSDNPTYETGTEPSSPDYEYEYGTEDGSDYGYIKEYPTYTYCCDEYDCECEYCGYCEYYCECDILAIVQPTPAPQPPVAAPAAAFVRDSRFNQIGDTINFATVAPSAIGTIGGNAALVYTQEFGSQTVLNVNPLVVGNNNNGVWALPLNSGIWDIGANNVVRIEFDIWTEWTRQHVHGWEARFNSNAGTLPVAGAIFGVRLTSNGLHPDGANQLTHLRYVTSASQGGNNRNLAPTGMVVENAPRHTMFHVALEANIVQRTGQIVVMNTYGDIVETIENIVLPATGIQSFSFGTARDGGNTWATWPGIPHGTETTYGAKINNISVFAYTTNELAVYPISLTLSEDGPIELQAGSGANMDLNDITITATVLPIHADNRNVIWSVYPAGIVTLEVNDDDDNIVVVTAVAEGEAILTATAALYPSGGTPHYADIQIAVIEPVTSFPESIDLGDFNPNILVGAMSTAAFRSFTVTADVYPYDATDTSVTWSVYPVGVVNIIPSGLGGRTLNIVGQTGAAATGIVNQGLIDGGYVTATITVATNFYGDEPIEESFVVTVRRQDTFVNPVPYMPGRFGYLDVRAPYAEWSHHSGTNFPTTGTGAAAVWDFGTPAGGTRGVISERHRVTHEYINRHLQFTTDNQSGQRMTTRNFPGGIAGNANVFISFDWMAGTIDNRCHGRRWDPLANDGEGAYVYNHVDQNALDFVIFDSSGPILNIVTGFDSTWPSAFCTLEDCDHENCTRATSNPQGGARMDINDRRITNAVRVAGSFPGDTTDRFMDRYEAANFYRFTNMMALEDWHLRWFTIGIDMDFGLQTAFLTIVEKGTTNIIERHEIPFSATDITGMRIDGRRTPANNMSFGNNGFNNFQIYTISLESVAIVDFLPPSEFAQHPRITYGPPNSTTVGPIGTRTMFYNWFMRTYIEDTHSIADIGLPTYLNAITYAGDEVVVNVIDWVVEEMPWMTHVEREARKAANGGQYYFDPNLRGVHTFVAIVEDVPGYAVNQMNLRPRVFVESRLANPLHNYPRAIDRVDRGLVVAPVRASIPGVNPTRPTGNEANFGMLVQWRLSVFEYILPENEWLTFNVLRNGTQLNNEPITIQNFIDPDGRPGDTYTLEVIRNGNVVEIAGPVIAWEQNFLEIPMQRPVPRPNPGHVMQRQITGNAAATVANGGIIDGEAFVNNISYVAVDVATGDIHGNGRMSVLVRWETNAQRDSGLTPRHTGETIFDMYWFNPDTGESGLYWRMNLGLNRPSSRHHNHFHLFDMTNSGLAQFAVKSADGVRIYHPDPVTGIVTETLNGGTPVYIMGGSNNPSSPVFNPLASRDYTALDSRSRFDAIWVGGMPAGTNNSHTVGRISDGPEFFTVFCGLTGIPVATTNYWANYDINRGSWGDTWNNRSDRYLAAVAFIPYRGVEGARPFPAMIENRGHYGPHFVEALQLLDTEVVRIQLPGNRGYGYTIRGGELVQIWNWYKGNWSVGGWAERTNRGNHNLSVADVNGIGYDTIILGSVAIDHRGHTLWEADGSRGTIPAVHGDAIHVTRMFPPLGSHPEGSGVRMSNEVYRFVSQEANPPHNVTLFNAATGQPIMTYCANTNDVDRGVAANVLPTPGFEFWADGGTLMHNIVTGERVATNNLNPERSHVAWWTGDLLREIVQGGTNSSIQKPQVIGGELSVTTLQNFAGRFDIETGGVMDVFGDWRENIIVPTNSAFGSTGPMTLRIFVTDFPTEHVLPTFLHDPQYRIAVSWQNAGYNQPPHPSFYLGEDIRDIVAARNLPVNRNVEYTRIPGEYTPAETFTVTFRNFFGGVAMNVEAEEGSTLYLPTEEDFADVLKWGLDWIRPERDFTGNWLAFTAGVWVEFTDIIDGSIIVNSNLVLMPEAAYVFTVRFLNFHNGVVEDIRVFENSMLTLPTEADFRAYPIRWGLGVDQRFEGEWREWTAGVWVEFTDIVDNTITVTSNLTIAPVAYTPGPTEPTEPVLTNATTSPRQFVSIRETSHNSRIWVVTFDVTKTFCNGDVEVVRYQIYIPGNNANQRGQYVFGAGHDLEGFTLVFDIRGNGSNIADFRLR